MRFDCKQINDIQILRLPNKTQKGPDLAKEQASQQKLIETLNKQNPMLSENEAPMLSGEGETPGGPGPF
jgi:hypothetical protein